MASSSVEAGNSGPPPSYDSLYGKFRHAQETSTGSINFLTIVSRIIVGTLGFAIILAVSLAFPIAEIVLGSVYLHDCQAQHYIPIYLIVGGVFGVLRGLITLGRRPKNSEEGQNEEEVQAYKTIHLIDCFLFCWTIAGAVWIYGIYMPNFDDPLASNYCHRAVYWYAFVCLTITFIGFAFIVCCCCCILCIGSAASS